MKSNKLKKNANFLQKRGFIDINREAIHQFNNLITGPLDFKNTERLQREFLLDPKYVLELLEQLKAISIQLTHDESLEALACLTAKEAASAQDIYKCLILAYGRLFDITQDLLDDWKLEHIRYFFSFFQKIARIPLENVHLEISMTILLEMITSYLEKLSEEEIQGLIVMGGDIFQSIDEQFSKEKRQGLSALDTKARSLCYSLMLQFYSFIYKVHPQQIALSKITRHLNKCQMEKIKLFPSAYIHCIEIIAATIKPDLSNIYACFKMLDSEEQMDIRIIRSFQKVLTTVSMRYFLDSTSDVLSSESLSQLIIMFNTLKSCCLINSYLNMIEIMSSNIRLLSTKQLQLIYSYAEGVLHYLYEVEGVNIDVEPIRKFFSQIFRLANAIDKPDLLKLQPVYHICLSKFFPEEMDEQLRQPMLNLLLKNQKYPVEHFVNYAKQVTCSAKLQIHEIGRLLSNLMNNYSEVEISRYLVEFCNQYSEEILKERRLTMLIIQRDQSFLETLENSACFIQKKHDYETLQSVCRESRQDIEKLKTITVFSKISKVVLDIIDAAENDIDDARSFEEASNFILQLRMKYFEFYALIEKVSCYDISIKACIAEFINILKQESCSIEKIDAYIFICEKNLNEEIKQIEEDNQHQLEFAQAQMMLQERGYDNLIKVNNWLRAPGENKDLYLMKIRCLKNLGYYEQALVWLERAKLTFSEEMDLQFYMLWANCCMSIGQYKTALEAYQFIYEKSDKKHINYNLRMQMAFCHQKLGGLENNAQASRIYMELKQHLMAIQEKVSDRKYNEKLLHQLTRVSVAEIRGGIYGNQISLDHAETLICSLRISEIEKLILQAELYLIQNLFKEASLKYEQALLQRFEYKWMKALLKCYSFNKDLTHEKMSFFRELLAQHESPVPEYYELEVEILMYQKLYHLALDRLHTMQTIYGINQLICLKKSQCYAKIGEIEEALKILSFFPDNRKNKVVLRKLAIIYAQAKMQQEALDCFDSLLEEYPMFMPSYYKAILYVILINDRERVLKYWTQFDEITDRKDSKDYLKLKSKVESFLSQASSDAIFKETIADSHSSKLEEVFDDDEEIELHRESCDDLPNEESLQENEDGCNLLSVSIFNSKTTITLNTVQSQEILKLS